MKATKDKVAARLPQDVTEVVASLPDSLICLAKINKR